MKMDFISYHRGPGIFWFRIFGYGITFKDTTKYALLFSERYGYTKSLRLGKWYIRILTRRIKMRNESKESQETTGHGSRDDNRTP